MGNLVFLTSLALMKRDSTVQTITKIFSSTLLLITKRTTKFIVTLFITKSEGISTIRSWTPTHQISMSINECIKSILVIFLQPNFSQSLSNVILSELRFATSVRTSYFNPSILHLLIIKNKYRLF